MAKTIGELLDILRDIPRHLPIAIGNCEPGVALGCRKHDDARVLWPITEKPAVHYPLRANPLKRHSLCGLETELFSFNQPEVTCPQCKYLLMDMLSFNHKQPVHIADENHDALCKAKDKWGLQIGMYEDSTCPDCDIIWEKKNGA